MRRKVAIVLVCLVFLAGVGISAYPLISDWYVGQHQANVIANYDVQAAALTEKMMNEEIKKAQEYNEELLGNVVLSDPFDLEGLKEQNTEYDQLLNFDEDGVMGSVEIPSIEVYLPIYHGTGSKELEKGVGHLQNSSLPVGGIGTHVVISGHTALPTAEMFNNLSELETGDVFYLHVLNETLAYEIDQIKVVLPENISDLLIDKDKDYVTLVTCTPYGINSHRLLVRGSRIPYEEAAMISDSQAETKKEPGIWRAYYLSAALAVLLLVGGGGYLWYRRKKK